MSFDLELYLNRGVRRLVREISLAAVKHPFLAAYMTRFAMTVKAAGRKRAEAAAGGEHIPAFLIASITTRCNLHCKGCYARSNRDCTDEAVEEKSLLSVSEWDGIFTEAESLGIVFIFLAGGEPFVRRDLLAVAAAHEGILFPVFTNGTMFDAAAMALLAQHPNLVPVLSIEGDRKITDARRGKGTYDKLTAAMAALKKQGQIFGCSVTVQKDNLKTVLGNAFVSSVARSGAKAILYVEYVPVDGSSTDLAPGDPERKYLAARLAALRKAYPKLVFIAFPGDEQALGGCLAAGRGFFHINPYGAAEPCPFSPHSDRSLKEVSLREALASPLFQKLRSWDALAESHVGGCTLFHQEGKIKAFLEEEK